METNLKIKDVVKSLETKLNTAIMQYIEGLGSEFSPLETDRYTTRFLLHTDTSKYNGFEWLKPTAQPNSDGSFSDSSISLVPSGKFVRLINGIVSVTGSNVEGGFTLEQKIPKNIAFGVSLTLLIPIIDENDSELITTIRDIIDNAMSLNYFGEFAGYNMSVVYSLGRTGERTSFKGIGDFISLNCEIDYAFVEGGINSTQMLVKYGNTLIYTTSKSISRVATQKSDVVLTENDNEAKSVTQSTVLTLQLDKPLQLGEFDRICTEFALIGDTGAVYPITITIPYGAGADEVV